MKKYSVLIEIIIFVLLFALCYGRYYDVVRYKDKSNGGGIENYSEVKADVDLAVYGSSHAGCTVDNSILWNEYGITSYTLGSAAQKTDGIYMYMVDSFRSKKPKIAMVETLYLGSLTDNDIDLSRTVLTTRFSIPSVKYIIDRCTALGKPREYIEDLIFRMPVVHSRYREVEREDFIDESTFNRGYKGSNECTVQPPPMLTGEVTEVSDDTKVYIDKIIDLCNENDVQLLFFTAPYSALEHEVSYQNGIHEYLESKGQVCLDFLSNYVQYDIDFSNDMREDSHLNNIGAGKITRAIGEYLTDNYQISDKKSLGQDFSDWDLHSRYLDNRDDMYVLWDCSGLDEYLGALSEMMDKYVVVVSFDGNYRAVEEYAERPRFDLLGITDEQYENGGTVIIRNGEVTYSSAGADSYMYYCRLSDPSEIVLDKRQENLSPQIMIDEHYFFEENNGFTVFVYDDDCNHIVDEMHLDVYSNDNMRHVEH